MIHTFAVVCALVLGTALTPPAAVAQTAAPAQPTTPAPTPAPAQATPPTPAPSTPAAPAAAPKLPENLFLTAAPTGAKQVKDAKPTLKAGDKVVLVGRIGGSKTPFVAERTIFTLVDTRLKYCGEENKEDKCKTPWDYCCETRKEITANSATVQVLGSDGKPMKLELNGMKGLKPLAIVTVVGTVAKAEGENVVITATGLFVTK